MKIRMRHVLYGKLTNLFKELLFHFVGISC
jgi:hypothetical protein